MSSIGETLKRVAASAAEGMAIYHGADLSRGKQPANNNIQQDKFKADLYFKGKEEKRNQERFKMDKESHNVSLEAAARKKKSEELVLSEQEQSAFEGVSVSERNIAGIFSKSPDQDFSRTISQHNEKYGLKPGDDRYIDPFSMKMNEDGSVGLTQGGKEQSIPKEFVDYYRDEWAKTRIGDIRQLGNGSSLVWNPATGQYDKHGKVATENVGKALDKKTDDVFKEFDSQSKAVGDDIDPSKITNNTAAKEAIEEVLGSANTGVMFHGFPTMKTTRIAKDLLETKVPLDQLKQETYALAAEKLNVPEVNDLQIKQYNQQHGREKGDPGYIMTFADEQDDWMDRYKADLSYSMYESMRETDPNTPYLPPYFFEELYGIPSATNEEMYSSDDPKIQAKALNDMKGRIPEEDLRELIRDKQGPSPLWVNLFNMNFKKLSKPIKDIHSKIGTKLQKNTKDSLRIPVKK